MKSVIAFLVVVCALSHCTSYVALSVVAVASVVVVIVSLSYDTNATAEGSN